jgi:hypothetical protein
VAILELFLKNLIFNVKIFEEVVDLPMEMIEEVVSSSHVEHIFPDQTAMDGGEVRSTPDNATYIHLDQPREY